MSDLNQRFSVSDVCSDLILIQSGTNSRPAGKCRLMIHLLQVEHQTLQHGVERLPAPLTPWSWEKQSIMGYYTSQVN